MQRPMSANGTVLTGSVTLPMAPCPWISLAFHAPSNQNGLVIGSYHSIPPQGQAFPALRPTYLFTTVLFGFTVVRKSATFVRNYIYVPRNGERPTTRRVNPQQCQARTNRL
ncbi:unnamed protein product [Somion occarium]|uniref:Uncharacterized protein n=1 Tax=Somion occarium TaxID=3059160 RepID=A0ABP1E8W6_9APHY